MLLSGHNQDLPCNYTQSKDIILILCFIFFTNVKVCFNENIHYLLLGGQTHNEVYPHI